MASLDIASRKMYYVNAGQSRPMLLRGHEVSILKGSGPRFPLGVINHPLYQSTSMDLQHGDTLLIYTDGASEAMNPKSEMYGEERLKHLFCALAQRHDSAKAIVDSLKSEIFRFAETAQQHDDLTIVVVKVL